jgi:RNA polymerase sigma-70 factor (ECF subfamily)
MSSESITTGDHSDEALYQRFRDNGDRDALDTLIERHRNDLINLATYYTGHRQRAEDAIQNACMAIIQKPASFKGNRGSFLAWFRTVVVNQVRCLHREETRRRRREQLAATDLSPQDSDIEDEPSAALEGLELKASLLELPVSYAEVLHLHYYGGLSPTEIASQLQAKPATIQSHLHRGIKQLRSRLGRVSALLLSLLLFGDGLSAACLPRALSRQVRRSLVAPTVGSLLSSRATVPVTAGLLIVAVIVSTVGLATTLPGQAEGTPSTQSALTPPSTLTPLEAPQLTALEQGWLTLPDAIAAWNWRHRSAPRALLFSCTVAIQSRGAVWVSTADLDIHDAEAFARRLAELNDVQLIWKHQVAFFSTRVPSRDGSFTGLANHLPSFLKGLPAEISNPDDRSLHALG